MQYSLYKKLFISGILLVGLQLQCGKLPQSSLDALGERVNNPSKDPSAGVIGSSCDKVKEAAILDGSDPSLADEKIELENAKKEMDKVVFALKDAKNALNNSDVKKNYDNAQKNYDDKYPKLKRKYDWAKANYEGAQGEALRSIRCSSPFGPRPRPFLG